MGQQGTAGRIFALMPNAATPLPYLVFDFDSTFTQVEGLDELADIALAGRSDAAERVAQIRALTDQGMAGEIGFQESLARRLALLGANERHLAPLICFFFPAQPTICLAACWWRSRAR